jgi:hypothetical protein
MAHLTRDGLPLTKAGTEAFGKKGEADREGKGEFRAEAKERKERQRQKRERKKEKAKQQQKKKKKKVTKDIRLETTLDRLLVRMSTRS